MTITKLHLIPAAVALAAAVTTVTVPSPASAAVARTASPRPVATAGPIRPIDQDRPPCPATVPVERLRWNVNHGNAEAVREFLRQCFPHLLERLDYADR